MNTQELTLQQKLITSFGMTWKEYQNQKFTRFFMYVEFLADERGLFYKDLITSKPLMSFYYTQWMIAEKLFYNDFKDYVETSITLEERNVLALSGMRMHFVDYLDKIKNYFPASVIKN